MDRRRMLLPDKRLKFENSVHAENDDCTRNGCTPVDCGCGWGALCDEPDNPQGCDALRERNANTQKGM